MSVSLPKLAFFIIHLFLVQPLYYTRTFLSAAFGFTSALNSCFHTKSSLVQLEMTKHLFIFWGWFQSVAWKLASSLTGFFCISGDLSDNMVANSRAITVLTWANFYLAKLTISEEIGLASWQNWRKRARFELHYHYHYIVDIAQANWQTEERRQDLHHKGEDVAQGS